MKSTTQDRTNKPSGILSVEKNLRSANKASLQTASDPTGFVQLITYTDNKCTQIDTTAVTYAVNVCLLYSTTNFMSQKVISGDAITFSLAYYSDTACTSIKSSTSLIMSNCFLNANLGYSFVSYTSGSTNTYTKPSAMTNPAIFSWYPGTSCGTNSYNVVYLNSAAACVNANACLPPATYSDVGVTVNGGSASTSGKLCGQTTTSSSSSSGCFSGSETVQLTSGETKLMKSVKMGDEILVSTLDGMEVSYSPVIAIPHGFNRVTALFIVLATNSGRQLKLTHDHLLLGGKCGTSFGLIRADMLNVSDCVKSLSGEEVIISTKSAPGQGVYTAVTKKNALLVVNGIMASPFATNHLVATSFYNIHRFVYKLAPNWAQTTFAMSVVKEFGDIVLSLF